MYNNINFSNFIPTCLFGFVQHRRLTAQVGRLLMILATRIFAHTMPWKVKMLVAQSRSTLCDHMDYSRPGSADHAILQARILEWFAIPFCRGSSRPRDQSWVSCPAGRFFTIWATREAHTMPEVNTHTHFKDVGPEEHVYGTGMRLTCP